MGFEGEGCYILVLDNRILQLQVLWNAVGIHTLSGELRNLRPWHPHIPSLQLSRRREGCHSLKMPQPCAKKRSQSRMEDSCRLKKALGIGQILDQSILFLRTKCGLARLVQDVQVWIRFCLLLLETYLRFASHARGPRRVFLISTEINCRSAIASQYPVKTGNWQERHSSFECMCYSSRCNKWFSCTSEAVNFKDWIERRIGGELTGSPGRFWGFE